MRLRMAPRLVHGQTRAKQTLWRSRGGAVLSHAAGNHASLDVAAAIEDREAVECSGRRARTYT